MKQIFIYYDNTVDLKTVPLIKEVENENQGFQECLRIFKQYKIAPVGFTYIDTDTEEEKTIFLNGEVKKHVGKKYVFIGEDFAVPVEDADTIIKMKIK